MAKKLLTLTLAAMMIVTFAVTASARTLVIDLADHFELYVDTNEGPMLMNSGNPERDLEGGVLWLVNRNLWYDNVDFVINAGDGGITTGEDRKFIGDANLPNGKYVLELEMIAAGDAMLQVGTGREAGFAAVATAPLGRSAKFTIEFEVVQNTELTARGQVRDCKVMLVKGEDGEMLTTGAFKFWTADPNETEGAPDNQVDIGIVSAKINSVTGSVAGNNNAGAGTDEKGGGETGVADVAVASAIAVIAAGAVVFSRKRK